MNPSRIDREQRVIVVDRKESADLMVLLDLISVPYDRALAPLEAGEVGISLRVEPGSSELDRAEGLLEEFNKMRSSRSSNQGS